MRKAQEFLKRGIKLLLVNGAQIHFWNDNWMGLGLLRQKFQGPLNNIQQNWKVSNVIVSLKMWDLKYSQNYSSKKFFCAIHSIYVNIGNKGKHELIWRWSKDGNFDFVIIFMLILVIRESMN